MPGGSLPRGWHRMNSKTGQRFYYNRFTQKTQWRKPRSNRSRASYWDVRGTLSRSPSPPQSPDREIICSHILIKHRDSSTPFDWHKQPVTRTCEEAKHLAYELRSKILSKVSSFEDVVTEFSDCSSARRVGYIGRIKPGDMYLSFEMIAFGLDVDEVSEVVESPLGFHIILRTE